MRLLSAGLIFALVSAAHAAPRERDQLNACKAMVARAAQTPATDLQVAGEPDALQRCRQIIKEWTLRDSRRSVDEDGRPIQ